MLEIAWVAKLLFGGASLEIVFIIFIYNFIYNGWRDDGALLGSLCDQNIILPG